MINITDQLKYSIIGYTSGVFDLLHEGHRNYLRECRRRCGYLVVGVDEDAIVRSKKGQSRPFQNNVVRMQLLQEEALADFIFKKSNSFEEIVESFRPKKYFVPSDRVLTESRLTLMNQLGIELVVIPRTDGVSTSLIAKDRRWNR